MVSRRRARSRLGGVAALAGVALVVAACGSSSSSSSSAPAASTSTASSGSNATATAVAIRTTKGSVGTYLTGASGRALYIWVADSNGKSACAGACAGAWPPLITKATPTVSGGAIAGDLGTITRSDGTKQVTYKGHPLYYYAGDTGPGTTNGQGSNQFGAKWWLISPSGGQVSASSSKSGPSSGTSTGTSSGSSGGGWG
jgi:predicted lipoprotein with Yx(FWY)xxD motif